MHIGSVNLQCFCIRCNIYSSLFSCFLPKLHKISLLLRTVSSITVPVHFMSFYFLPPDITCTTEFHSNPHWRNVFRWKYTWYLSSFFFFFKSLQYACSFSSSCCQPCCLKGFRFATVHQNARELVNQLRTSQQVVLDWLLVWAVCLLCPSSTRAFSCSSRIVCALIQPVAFIKSWWQWSHSVTFGWKTNHAEVDCSGTQIAKCYWWELDLEI